MKKPEQMKNDLNKPWKKENGKNTTIRGTRARGKEEERDKKEVTNVRRLAISQEDFKRQISFDWKVGTNVVHAEPLPFAGISTPC